MLSMFTRLTGNDSKTSAEHPIIQHFTSKRLAIHSALTICVICTSSTLLTGCGGGTDPTTRITSGPAPTVNNRTSFNATIMSPVLLNNVKAVAIDSTTGNILDQQVISHSNTVVLAIPLSYITTSNIIVLRLDPIDSSSSYYDPMLANGQGATAVFNQTLHALINMSKTDQSYKVDPFSEIAYQRALIRTGTFDINAPKLERLSVEQLGLSNTEVTKSFGTDTTSPYSSDFNSIKNIASQHAYKPLTTGFTEKPIDQGVQSYLFGIAQLALFAENNSSNPTPYLSFAARAALDLRDGDLDGMTTFGGDQPGTVNITDPILYSGVTSLANNDPDHTDIASLITLSSAQRNARGNALKAATNLYFNKINAALPAASRSDADTIMFLQNADYAVFKAPSSTLGTVAGTVTTPTPLSQVGAGNYTKAFGLPTGVDFKYALDSDDISNRTNDIIQLSGIYKNSSGCQLNIGYDGSFELSQGEKTYHAMISRDYPDSLVRISGTQYRLNVITGDATPPTFIQIITNGAQVVSATEGRSTLLIPTTLNPIDLTCTF